MEVAAAVRQMLAAASLPLDLERSALLEQSLALQAALAAARGALSAEQQARLIRLRARCAVLRPLPRWPGCNSVQHYRYCREGVAQHW